jgi:hypothetical protein
MSWHSYRTLWLLALFIGGLACLGTSRLWGQNFSMPARQADFKTFIDGFMADYAYRDRAERPWETWQSRYSASIGSTNSPEAYAAVFESALDELHDFHAEVRSRNPHRWLPVPTFADIWADFHGSDAVVVAVRRGSDAARAGIVPGDRVIRIGSDSLETALAERLTPAVGNDDPKARAWALLSLLTGRADEVRHFTVADRSGQSRSVTLELERHVDRDAGALASMVLAGNIGLVGVRATHPGASLDRLAAPVK